MPSKLDEGDKKQIHKNPLETEAKSYEKLLEHIPAVRGQVARVLAEYTLMQDWEGLTDREIDDLCEKKFGVRGRETYRKRRNELYRAGIVEAAPATRIPHTSKKTTNEQQVWRMVPSKAIEETVRGGDINSHIVDANFGPSPKKKRDTSTKESDLPSDNRRKLVVAQEALLRIKSTLEDHRANALEDMVWRIACDGLGISYETDPDNPKEEELPTDIYTPTKRRAMSAKRRLKIFLDHSSICCLCKSKIDGTRERWIVEHLTPLADGGLDDDKNCAPAHESCAKPKTKKEAGDRARMRKSAESRFGAKEKTGFATNRSGTWKKKMDGSVVRRDK